jgi:hypothetical protein
MNLAGRVDLRKTIAWTATWCVGLLAVTLSGCGTGGEFGVAPVSGKVTHQGQPVTGGSLVFAPVPSSDGSAKVGKPAAGEVQSDGSYKLSTYAASDGAVVGKHRVRYSPPQMPLPPGKTLQPGEGLPPSPFDGLVPKETQVDVKKGNNEIAIELVAPGGAGQAAPAP